jgi:DNA-binding NtrC family response regulator
MVPDVLILDDEPEICEILAAVVAKAGFRSISFNDPQLALAYLKENEPQLIYSDISMPNMTGLELLAHLKLLDISSAVVMVTAHQESEKIVEALRLGCIDFVNKPFKNQKLIELTAIWVELGKRLIDLKNAKTSDDLEHRLRLINLYNVKANKVMKQE